MSRRAIYGSVKPESVFVSIKNANEGWYETYDDTVYPKGSIVYVMFNKCLVNHGVGIIETAHARYNDVKLVRIPDGIDIIVGN